MAHFGAPAVSCLFLAKGKDGLERWLDPLATKPTPAWREVPIGTGAARQTFSGQTRQTELEWAPYGQDGSHVLLPFPCSL